MKLGIKLYSFYLQNNQISSIFFDNFQKTMIQFLKIDIKSNINNCEETMKSMGNLLRDGRQAAKKKITLDEMADACNRDTGYLSKLERGIVPANLSRKEVTNIAKLFRDRGVPETLINEIETTGQTGRISAGQALDEASDIIQMAHETLNELDTAEAGDYKKEIETRAYIWHGVHLAYEGINKQSFLDTLNNLQILERMERESTYRVQARIQLLMSQMHRYLAQIPSAAEKLRRAVELASESGDDELWTYTLKIRGDFYRRHNQKNLNLALKDYQDAFAVFSKRKDEDGKATMQLRIASIYLTAGLPLKARPICEAVLKYAEIRRNDYLHRKALEYKAWVMSLLGNPDQALALQKEAHNLTVRTGQPQEIAKSHTYLGVYLLECGLIEEAELAYQYAEDNISLILDKMRESGEAEAQELFIRCAIDLGLGGVKIKQANGHKNSRIYLNKSLEIAGQLTDHFIMGRSQILLGEIDLKDSDTQNARIRFDAATSLFQFSNIQETDQDPTSNPYFIAELHLKYATLDILEGKFSDAEKHINTSKELSEKYGFEEKKIFAEIIESRLLVAQQREFEPKEIAPKIIKVIEAGLRKGPYFLKVVVALLDDLMQFAQESNVERAMKTSKLVAESEQQIMTSKSSLSDKQINLLENWFKRVKKSTSDWESINKAAKLSKSKGE
ncbi:MAG: hypothetical protein JNM46_00320 [Anaerolineales bacterium]|nr:hypothetical protein [Anaerolineales bacterium]